MKYSIVKWILGSLFAMFTLFFVVVCLSIVPDATDENCVTVTGTLERVYEGGGEADIVFHLQDDENYYYINRGLEQGIDLHKLKEDLTNDEVAITYIDHWSALDPSNKSRHIAKVEWHGQEIYNEGIN